MSFINWLVAKIHPDFNKNGKDDVKEITEAANLALAKLQHAISTIDYKTMIVHAKDIADALSVVAQNVERIRSLVDTPEVKAALHELLEVTNKCITLIGSFAAQNKVAMLEQKDEGIA